MFQIEFEKDAHLLIVRKSGFWTDEIIERYRNELARALLQLKGLGHPTRCLIDQSAMDVQSPAYVEGMQRILAATKADIPDRTASVIPGALAKLQDKRFIEPSQPGYRVFSDIDAARAWLMAA